MKAKVDSENGNRCEVFSSCPNSTRAIACPRRLSGPWFQPPTSKEKIGEEGKPGRAANCNTDKKQFNLDKGKICFILFFRSQVPIFDRTSEGTMKMPSKNKNAVVSYVLRKHGRIQPEMLLVIVLSRNVKIRPLLEEKGQVNCTRNFNERQRPKKTWQFYHALSTPDIPGIRCN